MLRYGLVVIGLGACATAGDGSTDPMPNPGVDASLPSMADAPAREPDAAMPCMTTTSQLLKNASFDETPAGVSWTATPVDPRYPLVTGDGNGTDYGINEHTQPYDAWMGGIVGANANDQLYQDVAIPDGTRMLVLTGMHDVRTSETGAAVRDTAEIAFVKLDGTPIEVALATDNTKPKTAWTQFTHTVTAELSGQTVRLRLKTHNDNVADTATSFYFDTFTLVATHCQ